MAIFALMGPFGSGKTTMACLTAVQKPVHVIDIDRKIRSMSLLQSAIKKGEITFKEIGETIHEGSLAGRLKALVNNDKPDRPPRGWAVFADYCASLEKDEQARRAGTIVVDTYTQLAPHLRAHIQFLCGHSKYQWDEWSIWKSIWMETTTVLVDYALGSCRVCGGFLDVKDSPNVKDYCPTCKDKLGSKDLIVNLHERVSEVPGEGNKKVTVTVSAKGGKQRTYVGDMKVKIAGSIEGSFGIEFGTHFTDVYALKVIMDKDNKPKWICRVMPDEQRDLRCSFSMSHTDWEPDFRQIRGVVARREIREEVKKSTPVSVAK